MDLVISQDLTELPSRQTGFIDGHRWHVVFPEHVWETMRKFQTDAKSETGLDLLIAGDLATGWCVYITVPSDHPLFGMTTEQLEDAGLYSSDPEITWAGYCPWNADDKSEWFFGWDYQRASHPITPEIIKYDALAVIELIDSNWDNNPLSSAGHR